MSSSTRGEVFISYSRRDAYWLERLQVHLKPLEREHLIEYWDDTRILAGDRWREEIRAALARAQAAILLISADFLASDFIFDEELLPLLESAQKEGLTVLPLIVAPSRFSRTVELSELQAFNDPLRSLSAMAPGDAEQVLDNVSARIEKVFSTPSPTVRPANHSPAETQQIVQQQSSVQVERALIVSDGEPSLYVPLIRVQDAKDLELTVIPEDGQDSMLLQKLRGVRGDVGIAYGLNAVMGRITNVLATREKGREEWHITLVRSERGYSGMEMTINGVTPDEQALVRARRVLLNEKSSRTTDVFLEAAFSGWSGGRRVEESPIPSNYQAFGKDRELFLESARLICIMVLYTTRTIEYATKLNLTLEGTTLHVDFEGVRPKVYSNVTPEHIRVRGSLQLA